MNFGFSGEMVFLFLLALILFGPKKLPEIGRQIGRFMNEFRRASNEFRSQIESEINAVESQSNLPIMPPIQAPLGSLASRILNPPPPEQIQAAETQIENQAEGAETAGSQSEARESNPAVSPAPSPVSSSKVAADV
jgi:TatA/E family protein of Tat protein translocase